jgi:DNA (cytosine-5)-methyltransferase 1
MKYASVCSGVEAASLAWESLGWEPVWFSEIEPFPCEVLKQRFPNVPNLGDMTKIKVEKLDNGDQKYTNGMGTDVIVPGGVDLLVGGTPCQSFSVAGKREGLEGASGLARTFVELLGAMQPRWFVWENVPGCLSSKSNAGIYDFNFLLASFAECGYTCAWRILDAQYVRVDGFPRAVPQRRRRVWVVGHIGADWRYPAEVLFEQQGLFGSYPPSRSKKHRDCRAVEDIAEHWCYDNQTYAREPAYTGDICCTLQSHIGKGGNTKPIIVSFALAENTINRSLHTGGNGSGYKQELAYTQNTAGAMGVSIPPNPPRMITPVECERLMGFPDNWTRIPWKGKPAEQCPDGHRYRACGNSMAVNVMRWIGMRIDEVDKMESVDK